MKIEILMKINRPIWLLTTNVQMQIYNVRLIHKILETFHLECRVGEKRTWLHHILEKSDLNGGRKFTVCTTQGAQSHHYSAPFYPFGSWFIVNKQSFNLQSLAHAAD